MEEQRNAQLDQLKLKAIQQILNGEIDDVPETLEQLRTVAEYEPGLDTEH
jgi:signal transduction histidine kinase